MLTVKTIPILSKMLAKIDVKPILKLLKEADIFKNAKDKKEALEELKGEKGVELGLKVVGEILPQLGEIGDDIPKFIALYKGVDLKEAENMDFSEVLGEIIHDEGIRRFFSNVLRRRAEQEH